VKAAATGFVHCHQPIILDVVGGLAAAIIAGLKNRSIPLGSSSWRNRRERSRGDTALGLSDRLARSADRYR
jgi:hypothetical protein